MKAMKHYFYPAFALATMLLATTSCSQDEGFNEPVGQVTNFSVSLQGATATRTIGDGTTATKLYYEVYEKSGKCIIDKVADISTSVNIEMPLLKGETYDIIFWAQAENSIYDAADLTQGNLKEIKATYDSNTKANQEVYDAFYNALNDFKADSKTHTIELRRPFAQLNLGTDDWEKVIGSETEQGGIDISLGLPVTETKAVVKGLANKFIPLTGVAEGDEEVIFHYNTIPEGNFNASNGTSYKYLSLNYLLVPSTKAPQGVDEYVKEDESGKANVDLEFTLKRNETELTTINVPNAPVQRNWRTNVIGSLLTGTAFDVIIEPDTDNDYETLSLLKEVLTKGGELTLYSNVTLTEALTIPEGVEAIINLNEHKLTVNTTTTVEGSLSISNGDLDITVADGDLSFGIYAKDNSVVDIKDTQIEVGANTAGVYFVGTTTVNLTNTNMNVAADGHGISSMQGATAANINLVGSTITAKNGYYGTYLCLSEGADIMIDENSFVNDLWIGAASKATITYAGNKPEVKTDGTAVEITYIGMNTTDYEGIYQDATNEKQYYINSAEGLLNMGKALSSVKTGEGGSITIDLLTDINMEGVEYPAFDKMWTVFNGNNHTISNLNIVQNRYGRSAGFYGYLGGNTINNLTLENVTVTGSQAGIFAGQAEGGTLNNCTIAGTNKVIWDENTNDAVTGNGVGAFIGVTVDGGNTTINGTVAEGATVTLYSGTMTPAWATNNKYYGGLCECPSYKTTEPTMNITDNGKVQYAPVSNSTELEAAINCASATEETVIYLAGGTYDQDLNLTLATRSQKGDLVFKAIEGEEPVFTGKVTLGYRDQGTSAAKWNANVTFEDITFDQASEAEHSIDVQDVKGVFLTSCKIIGNGEYGIGSARGNATATSKMYDCDFVNTAMQLLGNFTTNLTIESCRFDESRINAQAGNTLKIMSSTFKNTLTNSDTNESFYVVRSNDIPITITDCTIAVDCSLSTVAESTEKWAVLWNRGETKAWTVSDVKITMTEAALEQTQLLVTKGVEKNTNSFDLINVTVNGTAYACTAGSLTKAINNGATEILLGGQFHMPSDRAKQCTVKMIGGWDNLIDMTWGAYWDSATFTFEKVNFKTGLGYVTTDGTKYGSDYAAFYSKNITYNECNFSGPMRVGRDGAKFVKCNFNDLVAGEENKADYIWTYGNACSFEGCVFNTAGKALLIYNDGGTASPAVSVTGCTFNATAGATASAIKGQNVAAIEIHNYGNGVTLTTGQNTVTENFSGEWRIKKYDNGGKIYVNDTEYTTIALDGKTMTLNEDGTVTVNN